MFEDFRFAYLIGDLLFGCVWAVLFFFRADLRREMLITGSLLGGVALLVAPLFYDYWRPFYAHPLGLEEFLYGFFAGGIASTIYEALYGSRFARRHTRRHHWGLLLFIFLVLAAVAFPILLSAQVLSIYASALLLILLGGWIVYFRRDLTADALWSGTFFTMITFVFFELYTFLFPGIVEAWWNIEALTFVEHFGYPVEELLWAFCFGFCVGPLYEFWAGLRFKRI